MSDNEEERSNLFRVMTLKGADNYADWQLSLGSTLLAKDLYDCIQSPLPTVSQPTTAAQKKELKRFAQTYAILIQSLSQIIRSSLSSAARNISQPDPQLLYQELEQQYSAISGARKAALLQEMWTSKVGEGENPSALMARIQSAHAQINAGGGNLGDDMLAYAMAMALPESYNTLKQSLWLRSPLTSAEVAGSVQAEWSRRQSEEQVGTALWTNKQQFRRPGNQQPFTQPSHNSNNKKKWCHYHKSTTHSSENCSTLKRKDQQHAQSNNTEASTTANVTSASPGNNNNTHSSSDEEAYASAHHTTNMDTVGTYIVDSGASHHMVNDPSLLTNMINIPNVDIKVGNGQLLKCLSSGTLTLGPFVQHGVLLVPGLRANLISVSKTTAGNWTFNSNSCSLYSNVNNQHILTAQLQHGLYVVKARDLAYSLAASADSGISSLEDWHQRLGHLNKESIMKLAREDRIEGLSQVGQQELKKFHCDYCIIGKGTRLPSPPNAIRASQPLETVHIDLWGPAPVPTKHGNTYFLTCYDDFTRKTHLYFLKFKSDAFKALVDYISLVENQLDTKVKNIRSDNGGEFTSNNFKQFMAAKGIQHIKVPPEAHAQNGRVERVHRTILNGVRTVLAQTGLDHSFWGEAANYICYTRNNSPSGPTGSIPNDLWSKRKTMLNHLQPFGCKLFYRLYTGQNKLNSRYRSGKLMGYEDNTQNFRLWDGEKNRIIISRDVIFPRPEKSTPGVQQIPIIFSPEDTSDTKEEPTSTTKVHPPDHQYINTLDPRPMDDKEEMDNASIPEEISEIGEEERPYLPDSSSFLASSNTLSYQQAVDSSEGEQWTSAIKEELNKMEKYKVWELVDRKPHMRVVGARWVFTRKIDGDTGLPSTHKARWVARGYSQIQGVDFTDLFASVVHKDTIRVLLSLVNHLDMECDQVDIKAAFLNGNLEEEIYLEPPQGSNIDSSKVLLLKKSLYGLKQSPRCFNKKLDSWLKSQGLHPTQADPCLYIKKHNNHTLLLSLHVDDQLIACTSRSMLDEFKRTLNKEFECSDGGPVKYFLGFNVHRNRSTKTLQVSQEHYLESILEKFNMSQCNPALTPLPSGFKPLPATDEEYQQAKHLPYAQLVGSILYASIITRPDLAHAASVLSRYMTKFNNQHWMAAKHLLRYIRGTVNYCLTFISTKDTSALGYADADWGGDLESRQSTTGYIFTLFGGPVAWRSKRQQTVALSTMEAEYMASTEAARQAIWIRQLLEDLGFGLGSAPLPIFNDNNGAISLAKDNVHHERAKHIALKHHFIREKVEDSTVALSHISSSNNLADIFTKALPRDTFNRLCEMIGIRRRSV